MPQNGYSIGRDVSLNIVTGQGLLRLRGITGFNSRQEDTKARIKTLDGNIENLRFFEGWTGRFDIERRDPTVDLYFNQLEANYFSGIGEAEVTITETITEVLGTVSQWTYRRVLLSLEEAGEWRADSAVKQALTFIASRRQ